jgi:hypothetical protein
LTSLQSNPAFIPSTNVPSAFGKGGFIGSCLLAFRSADRQSQFLPIRFYFP